MDAFCSLSLKAAEHALSKLPPSATQEDTIAALRGLGDLCDDDFFVYSFKVVPCAKSYSHKWTLCPCAHQGETARRRDPRTTPYKAFLCPLVKAKKVCSLGDACGYAHNVFEHWLHPARYKTRLCSFGRNCNRPICFFAHTVEELRCATTSELSDSRDSDTDPAMVRYMMAQETGLLQLSPVEASHLPPSVSNSVLYPQLHNMNQPTYQTPYQPQNPVLPGDASQLNGGRFKAPARTTVAITRVHPQSSMLAVQQQQQQQQQDSERFELRGSELSNIFIAAGLQHSSSNHLGGGSGDLGSQTALFNAFMQSDATLSGACVSDSNNNSNNVFACTQSEGVLLSSSDSAYPSSSLSALHQYARGSETGSSYSGLSRGNSGNLFPSGPLPAGLEGLLPYVNNAFSGNKPQQQHRTSHQPLQPHQLAHHDMYCSSNVSSGTLPPVLQTQAPIFPDGSVSSGMRKLPNIPPPVSSAFSSNASVSSSEFPFCDLQRSDSFESYEGNGITNNGNVAEARVSPKQNGGGASSGNGAASGAAHAGVTQMLAQLQDQGCSKDQLIVCLSQIVAALLSPQQ